MKPFLSEVAAGVEALSLWILRITIVLVTLGEYSGSSACSAARQPALLAQTAEDTSHTPALQRLLSCCFCGVETTGVG